MTDTTTEQTPGQIVLPNGLVSSIDLSRMVRELTALDESISQTSLRAPGEPTRLAATGATLEELAGANKVQLTDQKQRMQLLELLKGFQKHAPRIHMSLAAEPTAKFTEKIVIWMRKNIHPLVLLEIGLQPNIAAGCIVRTNNKMFDMSLRHCFTEKRSLLVEKIAEVGQQTSTLSGTVPAAPAADTVEAILAPESTEAEVPAAADSTPLPTQPGATA